MTEPLTTYSERLREAIESAGTSRTRLSVELADKTGNSAKSEYRSLGKYLSGEEEPSPDRAAILAVLLTEARLALVRPVAARRRNHQQQLEARVELIEESLNRLGPDLGALASLPDRVTALERQVPPGKRQDGQSR